MKTRSVIYSLIVSFFILFTSCERTVKNISYNNNFDEVNNRVWLGSDFWSVPLEDFQISNGRIECIGNRPNMRVNLLTYLIKSGSGEFIISFNAGLIKKQEKEGTVGLSLGVKDPEDKDIKAACYFGKGIDLGLRTDGYIFIEDQTKALPEDFNWEKFRLEVSGDFSSPENKIVLRILNEDNMEAGTLESENIDDLEGLIVLANNFHVPRPFSEGPLFWFDDLEVKGTKIIQEENNAFGAILWAMYTNSRKVLKLTAQLAPINTNSNEEIRLEIFVDNKWKEISSRAIEKDSYTATFRIVDWNPDEEVKYKLVYEEHQKDGKILSHEYKGIIPKDPQDKALILAALTCQYGYGFPYSPLTANLKKQNPDLLYFSGDQIYEGNGGYSIIRFPADKAILNYLGKWYMFGWAFGDLMRDRPTVCTPDDHDIFQGNIWGAGGRKIESDEWQRIYGTGGGYIEPDSMVNVVHTTQCAHLPDPYDPTPMEQGIKVWYTDMVYGRVSFAIISDRIFKSGPEKVAFWEQGRKDWIVTPVKDLSRLDKPGLKIIGDRQFQFLKSWMQDWRGADIKVLLSQTIFANIPTHHGGNKEVLAGDLDSGGWPQTPRNKVVDLLRKCYAFHISGDQHIPLFVRYGIKDYQDAGWAFCTPAITVGYQRRFLPDIMGIPVSNRPEHKLANTGEYIGGIGHKNYVYAVGNPADDTKSENRYERAQLCASGYAMINFDKQTREINCDAIRFMAELENVSSENHFPGWPVTINQFDNSGKQPEKTPLVIEVTGIRNPVLLVYDKETEELVLSIRMKGEHFSASVRGSGFYKVKVGDPESDLWKSFDNISPVEEAGKPLVVEF